MRVLITGGAGFIGSHLADTYVSQGADVTLLDNLSTGSQKNISQLMGKVKIVNGDIRSRELVDELTEQSDLILHMAAALGVKNILENPLESISINFQGSEVVIKSALKFDKRLVIASTSEIYGKNNNQPLSEEDDRLIGSPTKIRWSYSDAKALEEAVAFFLFSTKNLKVTTIRFFNTVGPRQTGKYGMVIPRFVEAALTGKPLEIYGEGNQKRVFCHVKDAVGAVVSLSATDRAIGEVFNVGGQGEVSILDLAHTIIKQLNSDSKINFIPYNYAYSEGFEDISRRVPNLDKIKSFIGWEPNISLNQIISDVAFAVSKDI